MMRSTTFALAIAALALVGSSTLLLSRSLPIVTATAAMPSLQELHMMAGTETLPVQHIDDRSVIFPTETKQ